MADLTIGVDGRRAAAGSRVVVRSLRDIQGAAGRTGRAVNTLDKRMKAASSTAAIFRRALTGLGAGLVAREFIRLSDSFTNVSNRLKLVTDGTHELVAVQEELFRISQETRTSFEANATLFNRLALSSKDLGISLDDVLQITQSLNQAVILSGAATTEASAGLIQLSQGLASNRLSGDELRSVLEQLPVVADVIAKQLGVTRGELKFFGEAGKISADIVIKAFQNAREELAVRFGETVPTVAQSFTILRNAAIRFVGRLNESTGIVTNLSRLIIKLAGNFDIFAKAVGVAAVSLGPLVFGRAIQAAIVGLRSLFFLVVSNPIGALVAGMVALTAAAIAFGDEPLGEILEDAEGGFLRSALEATGFADRIREAGLEQATFGDIARAVLQQIVDNIKRAAEFFQTAWLTALNKVSEFIGLGAVSWTDLFGVIRTVVNRAIGLVVGLGKATAVVFSEVGQLIGRGFVTIFNFVKEPIAAVVDFARRALSFVAGIVSKIFGEVKTAAASVIDELGVEGSDVANLPIIDDAGRIGGLAKDAFIEAWDTDYVGAIGEFLSPQISEVIGRTATIAEARLKAAADRLAGQQGVDLTSKEEGALIVRPEDARAIEKLIAKTQTPLEKYLSTLKELERLRPFARTAEEITAIDRAIEQAGFDRISEEFKNLGLDDLDTVMSEALGPLQQYNLALEGLNKLFKDGVINQEQFDAAVKNAGDKILGIKDIYADFAEEAAKSIQGAFADFLFDPFEDGLDGMLRGLADTLRRAAAEVLSAQILKSFLGLFGSGGAALAGALAEGGPAAAGKSYLVGENGPEIFTPRQSGTVTPNGEMPPQAAPNVNVAGPTIVNTIQDSDIVSAFNRGGGGQVVLNDMSENRSAYRNALGLEG